MSDTKLDPRSLTSEERAIWDSFAREGVHHGDDWDSSYRRNEEVAMAAIKERRALFGEPASEPAKVEYKNCHHGCGASIRFEDGLQVEYHDCKPAQPEPVAAEEYSEYDLHREAREADLRLFPQPEPVAAEMPEAVSTALKSMRFAASNPHISDAETKGLLDNADALESFWRTHASQPASVRMTEELDWLLSFIETNVRDNEGHGSYVDTTAFLNFRRTILKNAAAVRSQAAEAGKVKLSNEQIRSMLGRTTWNNKEMNAYECGIRDALAELDATEGVKG